MTEVDRLWDQHQQDRSSMVEEVRAYESQYRGSDQMNKLKDIHLTVLTAMGKTELEADTITASLFEGKAGDLNGVHHLCPSMFAFGDASLWRGKPPNGTIRKLAKSIISSGFRQDSVISSRTLDITAPEGANNLVSFHLKLGDGASRALAACLVWKITTQHVGRIPQAEPAIEAMILSLLSMTVSFERHGTGSPREALVAQVSRQNQAAAVAPVSTFQWIGMLREYTGLKIGAHTGGVAQLHQSLDSLVSDYNQHPDVTAYDQADLVQLRKKRRTSGSQQKLDDGDSGLKIGQKRLYAMKAFLAGATEEVWQELCTHVCVVGDYKGSVMSDDILQLKWLYVGSKLPREILPCPNDIVARDAVSDASKKLIPIGAASAEVLFDTVLTPDECRLVWGKLIKTFELSIEGLETIQAKSKHRPTVEIFMQTRRIIQFWSLSMAPCAKKDLSHEDFEQFRIMVFTTDHLDKDIVSILERVPKWFHMGLLPHIAAEDGPVEDNVVKLTQMQETAESAMYNVLEAELDADWKLIKLTAEGLNALRELTSWIANRHRRGQAIIGEALVSEFCKNRFPLVELPTWEKVPGTVSVFQKAFNKNSGQMRAVLLMDFNAPNSRDTLKIPSMCNAAAAMCQMFGPSETVLMAWMPNCCKEGSSTSPFDDEVLIQKHLIAAGFGKQDRIRMQLDMPASVSTKTSALDWWVDGRLCYYTSKTFQFDPKDNFWMCNSELARTHAVRQRAMVPEPDQMVEVVSLLADEDLNTSNRYLDVSEKCAQRGVEVSLVQLTALMEKTQRANPQLVDRSDTTVVIDFHPHVGDRALATYEYQKQFNGANGHFHHLILCIGKGYHFKHSTYAAARVGERVATDWIEDKVELRDPKGIVVKPIRDAPAPTSEDLKLYRGCAEAYAGLGKLDLKTCVLAGSKIKIRPDKLAVFSNASPEIVGKVSKLQEKHTDQFESCLASMAPKEDNTENHTLLEDQRTDPDPAADDPGAEKYIIFESVDALKVAFKIAAECKSSVKGVVMYRDQDSKAIFFCATREEVTLKPGDFLGGVGGGILVDSDELKVKAVPWTLPFGDKTWVQLENNKNKEKDADGIKCKYSSGTLYSCLRELDSKSTKPIVLTSFGEAKPITENGSQQYTFATPPGAENHRPMDYALTTGTPNTKTTSHNFFGPVLDRSTGFGSGGLRTTWRLAFDPIAHTLKPSKVHVTSAKRIVLPKGQPVKVAWHPV